MATTIDRDSIKKALRELIREEPEFLRELLADFVTEEEQRLKESQASEEEFTKSLRSVFATYGDTLKRLA